MRVLITAMVAVVLALAAPSAALAITAGVSGNTLTIVGGNEANNVDLDGTDSNTFYVRDTAGVAAAPGCTVDSGTPNVLDCGDATTTKVVASLGGGNDRLTDDCIFCGTIFLWHHPLTSFAVDTGSGNNNVKLWQTTGIGHTIETGDGNNVVSVGTAGSSKNVYVGGNGTDEFDLPPGPNEVLLGDGTNTVSGADGSDTIYGGRGHNTINDGFICGATCTVGSTIMYGVDGGTDAVTCDEGANAVYVDQFDSVSSTCTNVHHVLVGSGKATAKPTIKAFPRHCVRHHGHKVCTAPKPLKNHAYHGSTSQGKSITVTTDKKGHFVAVSDKAVNFLCRAGNGQHATSGAENLQIAFRDKQAISKKKGTFSTEVDFDPGGGWSHEVIYVVGAFDGHKARGTIVGNAQIAGNGECTTGKVSWSAHG